MVLRTERIQRDNRSSNTGCFVNRQARKLGEPAEVLLMRWCLRVEIVEVAAVQVALAFLLLVPSMCRPMAASEADSRWTGVAQDAQDQDDQDVEVETGSTTRAGFEEMP